MEQNKIKLEDWLSQATNHIRFGPNQKAVAAELREHIEDKFFDLKRLYPDMPEEELLQRALSQMGDAEEIGKMLASVHNSWLDFLWTISSLFMWPMVAFLAVIIAFWLFWVPILIFHEEYNDDILKVFWADNYPPTEPYTELEPPEEQVRIDNRLLSMEDVYLYDSRVWEEGGQLQMTMKTVSPYFWVPVNSFVNRITAADSLGNTWYSMQEWRELPDETRQGSVPYVRTRQHDNGIMPHGFSDRFTLQLNYIDPNADWVCIEYDWMGRSFGMTVDLKEGTG